MTEYSINCWPLFTNICQETCSFLSYPRLLLNINTPGSVLQQVEPFQRLEPLLCLDIQPDDSLYPVDSFVLLFTYTQSKVFISFIVYLCTDFVIFNRNTSDFINSFPNKNCIRCHFVSAGLIGARVQWISNHFPHM